MRANATVKVREPYDWDAIVGFLAARAIPGVEVVEHGVYRRTARIGGNATTIEVRRAKKGALEVRIDEVEARDVEASVARIARAFDIDHDPAALVGALGKKTKIGPLVRARPGMRVPGAWDAFELGVRAILGQQVSVAGASTLSGRVASMFGDAIAGGAPGLDRLFPTAEKVAEAEIEKVGMPRARAETIRALGRAAAKGELEACRGLGLEETVARLCAIPGIGPWTANYMAMRAFGQTDAFPCSDLGLRKALGEAGALASVREVEAAAERWRPFRAYAAMQLWASLASGG